MPKATKPKLDRVHMAHNVAAAILSNRWASDEISAAIGLAFQSTAQRSITGLTNGILAKVSTAYPPSPIDLAYIIWQHPSFRTLCKSADRKKVPPPVPLDPPCFNPAPMFQGLEIPQITTSTDLADWLNVSHERLDWIADQLGTASKTNIPILQNYRFHFVAKRRGPPRVIEAPKPALRVIQKRILRSILDKVAPHDAAHGFVAGRSAHSGAQLHCGEDVVICADLKDFFLTSPVPRVHCLFRSLGYPWRVARLLTGLCTSSMPMQVFGRLPEAERHDWQTRRQYAQPHLPAGAPTSPALANLVAFRLDARLAGLARSFDANYTRYADDLAFSGGERLSRAAAKFVDAVGDIAKEEGYRLNRDKTRIATRARRQQVTGIVVNQHNNVARGDFDVLKATLFNCVRNGPNAENRSGHPDFREHLNGRVTWVENVNKARGRKLRGLFDQIEW